MPTQLLQINKVKALNLGYFLHCSFSPFQASKTEQCISRESPQQLQFWQFLRAHKHWGFYS